MKVPAARLGLTLSLCLLPSLLFAQDDFRGQWELNSRYSTNRMTAVDLTVSGSSDSIVVTRTGRFLSWRHRDKPAFTWTSSRVLASKTMLLVTYYVMDDGTSATGLINGLTHKSSREEVVSALSRTHTFKTLYRLSPDKRTLTEVVTNETRRGKHDWWHWISGDGKRTVAPALPTLTRAQYESLRDLSIESSYLKGVRNYYKEVLDDTSLTSAERRDLKAQRALDLDFSNTSIEPGDDWFEMDIEERYDFINDPFHDAHGQVIPRTALEIVTHIYYPEYAGGAGYAKAYVFDTRNGALVAEGDTMN